MVDPTKVTIYDRTDAQLEEFLLFCIAVAGKNATTTSKNLEALLDFGADYCDGGPFEIVKAINAFRPLNKVLKDFGFGCHGLKAKGFLAAANSGLDLRSCTAADLEQIPGVGMKTSRYFLLHTRRDANVACFDTHLLKWLSYYSGHDVPRHTPTGKRYLELEAAYLKIAEVLKMNPADLDLRIWNRSRGSDAESLDSTTPKKDG